MDGDCKYVFDVYTEIDGDKAVGITHGYIPSDRERGDNLMSSRKKERESKFPMDRILQSINVDVKKAQASMESDRKFILNTITGRSFEDKVLDNDAKYDELNNILRGIFVTPALERIIKERDADTINRCLEIVKVCNARIIDLDLQRCSSFNDIVAINLADSLPHTLTEFKLLSRGSAVTVNGINTCLRKTMKCPQLEKLSLMINNIGDDGAKVIADALKVNHTLETLNLWYNNIGDDGAKKIADALIFNRNLKELNLSGNKMSADGIEYLTKRKQKLEEVSFNLSIKC